MTQQIVGSWSQRKYDRLNIQSPKPKSHKNRLYLIQYLLVFLKQINKYSRASTTNNAYHDI